MPGEKLSEAFDHAVSALQDPTRRAILLDFYMSEAERTVDDVAQAAGVHRTVAFAHLERLVALGYLGTGQRRGRAGKPAKLYRLSAPPIELSYPIRRFELLSMLLATSLKSFGQKGIESVRQTARRFGASLITKPAQSVRTAIDQLLPMGAEYTVTPAKQVVAANCVFREACQKNPHVVRQLHASLLEGALRQAGIIGRIRHVECRGAGCSFRLVS